LYIYIYMGQPNPSKVWMSSNRVALEAARIDVHRKWTPLSAESGEIGRTHAVKT